MTAIKRPKGKSGKNHTHMQDEEGHDLCVWCKGKLKGHRRCKRCQSTIHKRDVGCEEVLESSVRNLCTYCLAKSLEVQPCYFEGDMTRCQLCSHSERDAIEALIRTGEVPRSHIVEKYGVSRYCVAYHIEDHMRDEPRESLNDILYQMRALRSRAILGNLDDAALIETMGVLSTNLEVLISRKY